MSKIPPLYHGFSAVNMEPLGKKRTFNHVESASPPTIADEPRVPKPKPTNRRSKPRTIVRRIIPRKQEPAPTTHEDGNKQGNDDPSLITKAAPDVGADKSASDTIEPIKVLTTETNESANKRKIPRTAINAIDPLLVCGDETNFQSPKTTPNFSNPFSENLQPPSQALPLQANRGTPNIELQYAPTEQLLNVKRSPAEFSSAQFELRPQKPEFSLYAETAAQALRMARTSYNDDKSDVPSEDDFPPVDSQDLEGQFYTSLSGEHHQRGDEDSHDEPLVANSLPGLHVKTPKEVLDTPDGPDPSHASISAQSQGIPSLNELHARYEPDNDNALSERPTGEDIAKVLEEYDTPITPKTAEAIRSLQDENLWLTAIVSRDYASVSRDISEGEDPWAWEYQCLIQRTPKTFEHARLTGDFLAKFAPSTFATYLVGLDQRPFKLPPSTKQDSETLWFIEAHRLRSCTFEGGRDVDDGASFDSQEAGSGTQECLVAVVDLYCWFTDGSKRWVDEMTAQKKHNAAVLTYWAGSTEGIQSWLQNHESHRTLLDKNGEPTQVEHWILKVLSHSYKKEGLTKHQRSKPKNVELAVQYCGYPAGRMWQGSINGEELKKYDPVMYAAYFDKPCAAKGRPKGA